MTPHFSKNKKWQKCSCLENPRNGGAWWAALYGVAQSRTGSKQLSSSSSSKGPVVVHTASSCSLLDHISCNDPQHPCLVSNMGSLLKCSSHGCPCNDCLPLSAIDSDHSFKFVSWAIPSPSVYFSIFTALYVTYLVVCYAFISFLPH